MITGGLKSYDDCNCFEEKNRYLNLSLFQEIKSDQVKKLFTIRERKVCCWTGVRTHVEKFWCLEGLLKNVFACWIPQIENKNRTGSIVEVVVGAARNWSGVGRKFSGISRPRLGQVALDFLGVSRRRWCLLLLSGLLDGRCSPRRRTMFGSRWRWSSLLSISPSAVLWLLLLRCCAHEGLLPQSRSRSRFQGHLVAVVIAIGLGRLQLGCLVVVVVGLRSQSWSHDQTVIETGLDWCWWWFWSGKEW